MRWLCLAALLLTVTAQAQVAHVSTSAEQNFNNASATPTAFAAGSVAGTNTIGILVVGWADLDGTTVAATWNGDAMTVLGTPPVATCGSGVECTCAILYKTAPAAGNVAITFGSAGNFGGAVALVYSGVDQATPFGTPDTSTTTGTGSTLTITDGQTGDMVLDCIIVDAGGGTLTPGDTLRLNEDGGSYDAGASDAPGAASVAKDWTWGSNNPKSHLAVNINQAAGGSPPTLSSPTPSGTLGTATAATIGATTDDTTGTFYAVVDDAGGISGITAAQIKLGNDSGDAAAIASCNAAVSTTSPSCGVTGLTASTAYSYAAVHNNSFGDSNVVTGTFTTAAAPSGSAVTVISTLIH